MKKGTDLSGKSSRTFNELETADHRPGSDSCDYYHEATPETSHSYKISNSSAQAEDSQELPEISTQGPGNMQSPGSSRSGAVREGRQAARQGDCALPPAHPP